MRISSQQFLTMNVSTMTDQQAQLSQLYQEISSGVSLSTPSDNPLGAAQAVQLSATAATLSQYASNQDAALGSLTQEDSVLGSVNTVLQSIQTLALRAGDSSLSNANRASMATQLTSLRSQLVTLANSTDQQGNFLFSGFQGASQPFTTDAGGNIVYAGDTGTRTMRVSDAAMVPTADNGESVFRSVASIGTSAVAAGSSGNTGTGVISTVSTTDPTNPANGDIYTITFGGGTPASTYTVDQTDATGVTTPGTAQPFTPGAITLGGQSVTISGAPAAGDTFSVTPAVRGSTDVFANLSSLISVLQQPVSGQAASANLQNAVNTGLTQLENTMNNVTTVRASVGGREQEVQALQTVTQTNTLQTQTGLSTLTSTNMTQAISRYTLTQTSLQAAQQAFVKVQNLSLFQYLN